MHCYVIKSLGGEQNGSDDLLQESIKVWKHTNENSTDLVTKATTTAVLYIAKHLLLNKAVLLPWVCKVFVQAYTGSSSSTNMYLHPIHTTV